MIVPTSTLSVTHLRIHGMYVYVNVCIIYIHIYICIYTHTHTHLCILSRTRNTHKSNEINTHIFRQCEV